MRVRREEDIDSSVPTLWKRDVRSGATCANPDGNLVTYDIEASSYVPRTWYREMHDVVTPNFAALSAKGKIINSPMWSETVEELDTPCQMDGQLHTRTWNTACTPDKWMYYQDRYYGTRASKSCLSAYGFSYLPLPAVDIDSLINQAVTQAWANIGDEKFDMLPSIMELRETLVSIRDIGFRLARFLRFLKKNLDNGRAWQRYLRGWTAKRFADQYMELRYSVRPLVYEIAGLMSALTAPNLDIGSRRTFRGFATDSDTVENESTFSWADPSYDQKSISGRRVSTREVSVRAGVLCHVTSSHWLDQWGFDNIPEALWEYTRLSFLYDWFIGIGSKIAAWTPEFGLKALTSWVVVEDVQFQSSEFTSATRNYQKPGAQTLVASLAVSGSASTSRTVRTRQINPQLSIFPAIKIKLDILKIADLLVILNQFRS